MRSNSSRKSRDQVLGVMSVKRAEEILNEWANVRETPQDVEAAYRRLIQLYPDIFPQELTERRRFDIAHVFGKLLRLAWDAPTPRKRNWYLHDAESFYRTTTNRFGDPPAEATPLEALVEHFRRNQDRALHCPNSDCVTPYFFATKKGQKYCSDRCALPAQREAKRRWWTKNKAKNKPRKEGDIE